MSESPRLRASDVQRDRVAAALSEAFSQGRLDYAEFDERTQMVWASKFTDELAAPLKDLYPEPFQVIGGSLTALIAEHSPALSPQNSTSLARVTGEKGGDKMSFALMGGSEKKGDWLCAPNHSSVAIMGGTLLDLRHARLQAQETIIETFALMGGVEIIVPEDVRVISDGIGIMGGFGISDGRGVSISQADLPPNAPVIRIRGMALMGGVDIKRMPLNSPK